MASDDVVLLIDGQEWTHWTEISIRTALDNISDITVHAPFEPDNPDHREAFRPASYKPLEVSIGGERIFRGTMVGVEPQATPTERSVTLTGYALPGVLRDCCAPGQRVPFEYRHLRLRVIVEQLLELFQLSYVLDGDDGARFTKVALDVDRKVLDFIADLARQRNLVCSSTVDGELLLWRSIQPGSPVARFRSAEFTSESVTPNFRPQEYYSEVTGFAKAKKRRVGGGKHTQQNTFLTGVLRPLCFRVEDSDAGDVPTATRAKLGRMFGNAVSYELTGVPSLRDPSGKLYRHNTTATLLHPETLCYRETEFLVRAVNFQITADKRLSSLGLVLPGAFSGAEPEALPWEE